MKRFPLTEDQKEKIVTIVLFTIAIVGLFSGWLLGHYKVPPPF